MEKNNARSLLPQVDKDMINFCINYKNETPLKDFCDRVKKNKTSIKPIFCRIEYNQNIKCQIPKCVKVGTFKDVSNEKIICWFHYFEYN